MTKNTATQASATQPPETDPTAIFEHFRGSYGTELLTVAVAHFNLFGQLAEGPKSFDQLCQDLQLESRPANVLVTALLAMQLIGRTANDRIAKNSRALMFSSLPVHFMQLVNVNVR